MTSMVGGQSATDGYAVKMTRLAALEILTNSGYDAEYAASRLENGTFKACATAGGGFVEFRDGTFTYSL